MIRLHENLEKNVQHELRTPLTAILGMTHFLKKEPLTAEQQNCVDCIFQSTNRLLDLAIYLEKTLDTRVKRAIRRKPRILLVEDDPFIQWIHKNMLLELECEVDVASNAREALNLARLDYDVMFLDVGLPDIRGIELAKKIRKNLKCSKVRLIALTAFTDETTRNACLNAGIEQVINKPVQASTLMEIINAHELNRKYPDD